MSYPFDKVAIALRRRNSRRQFSANPAAFGVRLMGHFVRYTDRRTIYVFEKEVDALKLANAVQADQAGRYPGWRSQRTFTLDAEACRAIAAALKEH